MKTTVIPDKGLSDFDAAILARLSLNSASAEELKQEHMRIGVRNEFHVIYREIGVSTLNEFLEVVDAFVEMGFIDELGSAHQPDDGYDAIFTPGRLH